MHIIHNTSNKSLSQGCVATIGNFDGLHLGHQTVIQQLLAEADKHNLPSVVITFEPLPREYFQKSQQTVARLMRLREKLVQLRNLGIDKTVIIHFNHRFSQLSAKIFVEQVLLEALNVQAIIVGDDFHFGYQREGNIAKLQQFGKQHGFTVTIADTYQLNHQRISSSLVRKALSTGDLALANSFLGRNYSMIGRVIRGDKRGRTIGFPTANIAIKRKISPLLGVYVVEMMLMDGAIVKGVANVGCRPTVDGTRVLLEVYLLDFNQEIYDQQVQVTFLKKLRDEEKFNSLDELKQQLHKDEQKTREFFE